MTVLVVVLAFFIALFLIIKNSPVESTNLKDITVNTIFLATGKYESRCLSKSHLFSPDPLLKDVISGFFVVLSGGLSGLAMGDLLNIRVMKNRKMSLILTVLIALLTITHEGICQEVSSLAILGYLLPTVMLPAKVM